jgi:hypothetical protein
MVVDTEATLNIMDENTLSKLRSQPKLCGCVTGTMFLSIWISACSPFILPIPSKQSAKLFIISYAFT